MDESEDEETLEYEIELVESSASSYTGAFESDGSDHEESCNLHNANSQQQQQTELERRNVEENDVRRDLEQVTTMQVVSSTNQLNEETTDSLISKSEDLKQHEETLKTGKKARTESPLNWISSIENEEIRNSLTQEEESWLAKCDEVIREDTKNNQEKEKNIPPAIKGTPILEAPSKITEEDDLVRREEQRFLQNNSHEPNLRVDSSFADSPEKATTTTEASNILIRIVDCGDSRESTEELAVPEGICLWDPLSSFGATKKPASGQPIELVLSEAPDEPQIEEEEEEEEEEVELQVMSYEPVESCSLVSELSPVQVDLTSCQQIPDLLVAESAALLFGEKAQTKPEPSEEEVPKLKLQENKNLTQVSNSEPCLIRTSGFLQSQEIHTGDALKASEMLQYDRLDLDDLERELALEQAELDELAAEAELERELAEEPELEQRQVQVRHDEAASELRSRYALADELGRGKFGTVYRCEELATGCQFAAKFVRLLQHQDRLNVLREIEIMSRLQHKRLLQLVDAFDDQVNGEMCLITELIEGGELFERIVDDDFRLTERKGALFMRQICDGVAYMHSLDILHLDLKPENILCVSRSGCRIKLIDFGLARQLEQGVALRVMFGTPDFAAPEVLAFEEVLPATDMWSVGVICYVLLSGLSPFMGESDLETMANVSRATYDFDDCAFEPISEVAKDFIARLLVRDPAERLGALECLQHPWLQPMHLQAPLTESHSPLASNKEQQVDNELEVRQSEVHSPLFSHTESEMMMIDGHIIDTPISSRRRSMGAARHAPATLLSDPHRVGFPKRANICETSDEPSMRSYTLPLMVSLDKGNLKRYVVRRKWHRTVHAILALNRMGANLRLSRPSGSLEHQTASRVDERKNADTC